MSNSDSQTTEPLVEPLTRREREILTYLAEGFSAPEIAEQLTLAISSVKFHIQNVYGKLGVKSKRQALTRAAELGLLSAQPTGAATAAPTQSLRTAPPVVKTPPAPKHNLPLQVTQFFGREAEIEQLSDRLSKHRLVTLTGSGGVGKTRLSLQAAEAMLPEFRDGVWLIELAPLTDPALIAQQVAASLGVHDEPGRPILESLTLHLANRQMLLVLDNCEHLLEGCARLADALLRACPEVKILASSRELLGSAGEAVFHVPSLSFPDPAHPPAMDELNKYVALRLFVDRARLLLPDYQIEAHNAAALARICQRLDGIPLAIELAAARINVLTAEQLAGRLDDAFRVLTGGSRSALPRQKTLRATIDWSYQLLTEPERLLLQRLSVFAGGCTLEAAEAVCAGDGLEAEQVLDLLASLVAKSMVAADRGPGEGLRYRLLETVRQYAEEKLYGAGESTKLRTRHRDYFLVYAETAVPYLEGRESLDWHRKLQPEIDNWRLALEWSFSDQGSAEAAPRLLIAMGQRSWRSHHEGLDWYTRGVALCESHPEISARLHVKLLDMASNFLALNDPPAALTLSERAVEISRSLGPVEKETLMWSLCNLAGRLLWDLDDADRAVGHLAEAEAILHTLAPDHYERDEGLRVTSDFAMSKADLAHRQGRYEDVKMYVSEATRLRQAAGVQFAFGNFQMGQACLHLAEYDQARDYFLTYIRLGQERNLQPIAYAIRWLAQAEFGMGNLDRALEYCHESLREAAKIPDRNIQASCLGLEATIFTQFGQRERVARLSGASAALWTRQKRKPWEDSSMDTLLPGWREQPDQAALAAAYAEGQAMMVEQSLTYGLRDATE